ncbi:MAG: PIN domain-containing protein [Patescibacteria group bacterium]
MGQVVVDTDIVIDYFRTGSGLFIKLYQKQLAGEIEILLSVVTVFEIFSGKSSKEDTDKITKFLNIIKIIPFSLGMSKLAGELHRDSPFPYGPLDLFIAVTTVAIGGSLATKNKRHFSIVPGIKFFQI